MIRKTSSKITERIGSVMALMSLGFIFVAFARNCQEIPPLIWSWLLFTSVLLSVMASGVSVLLMSYVWWTLLNKVDVELSVSKSFVICWKAQILKYLPGNVFHLVGRSSLAVREGIPLGIVISSMTLETILTVATTALVSLPLAWTRWHDISQLINVWDWWKTLLACLIGTLIVFFISRFLRACLQSTGVSLLRMSARATYIKAVPSIVLATLVTGSTFYFFAVSAWPEMTGISVQTCICGLALAWVIGFLTPGAPGGIGIRELVFLTLFAGSIGDGMAAALAISFRLLSVVGDIFTFLSALVAERIMSRSSHIRVD